MQPPLTSLAPATSPPLTFWHAGALGGGVAPSPFQEGMPPGRPRSLLFYISGYGAKNPRGSLTGLEITTLAVNSYWEKKKARYFCRVATALLPDTLLTLESHFSHRARRTHAKIPPLPPDGCKLPCYLLGFPLFWLAIMCLGPWELVYLPNPPFRDSLLWKIMSQLTFNFQTSVFSLSKTNSLSPEKKRGKLVVFFP